MNGNVFAVLGACRQTLRRAGLNDAAVELAERALQGDNRYNDILAIVQEYCDFDL